MSPASDLEDYVADPDPEAEPPAGVNGRGDPYQDEDGCTYVPVHISGPRPHRTDVHHPSCERC